MDRDHSENRVDSVERVSPSTGNSDTGEVGDQQARIHKERQKRGTEPAIASRKRAPEPDRAPGRNT